MKKQIYYGLALLEEIRHLLAENLLINARIYDKLRDPQLTDVYSDPTYETATEITNKSFSIIDKLHRELEAEK